MRRNHRYEFFQSFFFFFFFFLERKRSFSSKERNVFIKVLDEPRSKKSGLLGFRPGLT